MDGMIPAVLQESDMMSSPMRTLGTNPARQNSTFWNLDLIIIW